MEESKFKFGPVYVERILGVSDVQFGLQTWWY